MLKRMSARVLTRVRVCARERAGVRLHACVCVCVRALSMSNEHVLCCSL